VTITEEDSSRARQKAVRVARRALLGEYDLLLACRELASLRADLAEVPIAVLDTFIAVASEIDDLPVGAERRNWSLDALRTSDLAASKYRDTVRPVVTSALHSLLESLGQSELDSRS
jgi:hypothetical protein